MVADRRNERQLTVSLWEYSMPLYNLAKLYKSTPDYKKFRCRAELLGQLLAMSDDFGGNVDRARDNTLQFLTGHWVGIYVGLLDLFQKCVIAHRLRKGGAELRNHGGRRRGWCNDRPPVFAATCI